MSANGTLAYTERQLWYEIHRSLPTRSAPGCLAAGLTAALAPLALLTGTLGASSPALGWSGRLSFPAFVDQVLPRWTEVHGKPAKMLSAEDVNRELPAPPEELRAFSFDRALILDNAPMAAMFVANRFHFENNCAVLSADSRYPAGPAFDAIMAMLRANSRLTVFTLHDASTQGMQVARSLRQSEWFPDRATRVVDLGLTPAQAQQARLPVERTEKSDADTDSLPDNECRWLADGNCSELAALRPAALLKVAWQGFSTASQAGDDGSWNDDGIWLMGYGWGAGAWAMAPVAAFSPHWGAGTPAMEAGATDSFG